MGILNNNCIHFTLITYCMLCSFSMNAANVNIVCDSIDDSIHVMDFPDSINSAPILDIAIDSIIRDSSVFVSDKKENWGMAIGQGVFINTLVWSIDKWALKRPYCSTGWETLKENIKRGFVWDCDALSTNFFDHPFHGAQYYNAARVNGLNFYQSSLLTLLGSLEWEELAETDYPAPNDMFSTTIGGVAFGEVTNRVSKILLNNRKRKLSRISCELINSVINPTFEVNRLIYGEAWRIDENKYLYHDKEEIPYNIYISLGSRWADAKTANSRCNVSTQLKIDYGKWTDLRHNKPFDQFMSTFVINPPSYHIPYFSEVNINARLYGWPVKESDNMNCILSINQDFTYFNNEKEERYKGDKRQVLHLAEPSSFGPALYLQTPHYKNLTTTNLAFIGAYVSDYYYRIYNMGSGFNVKSYNNWNWNEKIELTLDFGFHYLFTWKGYEADQIKAFQEQGKEPPYTFKKEARKAGDKGYATFFMIKPRMDINLFSNVYVSLIAQLANRNSVYKYHENVKSYYNEFIMALTYKFK